MDKVARVFFEQEFKLGLYEKRGEEFEDWFAKIMELRFPGDFKRVRPWGKFGDRKNDGYLRSRRTMFQVYAPNEVAERETLKKINSDYEGAVPFWKEYFDKWVFVHNSIDGLSPNVTQQLLELDTKGPFVVDHWGAPELHSIVFELTPAKLQALFRVPPVTADLHGLSYDNLENILQFVARKPLLGSNDVNEVPPGKLDANGLSDDSKELILQGNKKSKYVGQFFDDWYDPAYGDEVSNAFRQEYSQLKSGNVSPDNILLRLLTFAGFRKVSDPSDITAVYAIIAYFFEVCDIFERPLEDFAK